MVKTYAVNCNDAWLNTEGDDISGSYVKYEDYAEIERRLLAAEAQEPVAWMQRDGDDVEYNGHNEFSGGGKGLPLYTAPPAPVSVPDGYRLQPISEYDAMCAAMVAPVAPGSLEQFAEFMACEAIKCGDDRNGWKSRASNAAYEYAELCRAAAAPTAPVAQPVQVPDGWKLVPVVPTREMREAFHVAHEEAESGDCDMWVPDHHWQAMLAAAPRPGNE